CGGDVDRTRDRREPLRHGAGARLRARAAGAPDERAGADRPSVPLDAGLLLVDPRGGRRRLGQPERVDRGEGRGVPRLVHARGRGLRARPRGGARPDRAGLPQDAAVAVAVPTLAIIGAGFMGSAHAANYAALGERVSVKAVVAQSPERAARVARTVDA